MLGGSLFALWPRGLPLPPWLAWPLVLGFAGVNASSVARAALGLARSRPLRATGENDEISTVSGGRSPSPGFSGGTIPRGRTGAIRRIPGDFGRA